MTNPLHHRQSIRQRLSSPSTSLLQTEGNQASREPGVGKKVRNAAAMPSLMASSQPGMPVSCSYSVPTPSPPLQSLPVRAVPGGYGWPMVGPLSDRLAYFWFQGPETFFRKRMERHQSSVFRTNLPPTFPFFFGVNPHVVALLDCRSYAHILDSDLVDKSDVLVGDFAPSLKFTGGRRVCAYLDTTEPQHTKIKDFSIGILKRSSAAWASELVSSLDTMWNGIEASVSQNGSASYLLPLQQWIFKFFSKCLLGADPITSPEIANSGHIMLDKWLALQLLPTVNIGILQPLEEIFLHSFAYPFFLVSGDYRKLVEFVEQEATEVIRRGAAEFGLSREETVHNLLFILGFNAFGGFSIFLPALIGNLGKDPALQARLREEVREKAAAGLRMETVKDLEKVQSFVYETLRYAPPVPLQYGRARRDFDLASHDAVFRIKKGELLVGFQKLVMRDPRVFEDPETFAADRFAGDRGRELLNYLYWSNGPQTGTPSAANKQCAGKDYVTATASLFVAHLFLRYDSITATSTSVTAIEKAKAS